MKHLPLVLDFENPKAFERGRRSRRTTTIAKQQLHFKVDAIAADYVFGQGSVKDEKMHTKKPNRKMEDP